MNSFLKWTLVILAVIALGLSVYAIAFEDIFSKRLSPKDTVKFELNDTKLEVFYNRPYKKGREVFGALVPYNEVWRTGANEATTFTTNKDLMIEGKLMPKGEYTLWTIPHDTVWEVIFNTKQYPLALKLDIAGPVEVAINEMENFDSSIAVFVYDSILGTYHSINDSSFVINLEAGTYDGRFYLTFSEDQALNIIDNDFKEITVKYLHGTNEIYIKTPGSINVKQVYMINIAGQVVKAWNTTNTTISHEMKIPVKDVSEGNYIIKIQTDTNNFNKKIIVKY